MISTFLFILRVMSHHLPPQVPHASFHPHYQTIQPNLHPHQPYTVELYRSCRRSGPRFFPLLLVGGVSVWASNKIYKLRQENYDLRDRIRSDDKASLASATIASTSLSLDEGKDTNNKATSGRGEWRRDWRGRRYGGPRGEEEA
ncbi:BQ5605_C001g00769 [Microbotryum silenes-dioicae]|uniref:BQ5605_C001g00769 protein n=1 Tax=Microbotryum silenes-dioicae TaxID=796604 RepID=A0A2X0M7K5_9BASI|nr:BQ5605_C001g00769 [Microbotryum silenes-dioicae]